MLRFVDQDGDGTPIGKRTLDSVMVFGSDCPRARHEPHNFVPDMDWCLRVDLIVDQRFVQLKLPDSGAMHSTLTTGRRPRSVSSTGSSSAARSCSIFARSVVLPTPVGPKTRISELAGTS